MRIGLSLLNFETPGHPAERFERVIEAVLAAESSEVFDSVWVGDHLNHIFGGPMLDSFTLLGAIAARTERVRLGVLVAAVSLRTPALIARAALTLDVISGGRAELGLGAGVGRAEHLAHGLPFPPTRERLERLEEAVSICRALFSGRRSDFQGRHFSLEGAEMDPPPLQPGGPPILIGGRSREALEIAARYGDAANLTYPTVSEVRERFALLDSLSIGAGRPAGSVRKTVMTAMVVGRNVSEANLAAEAFRERRNMPRERFDETVVAGGPAAARDRIAELEAVGVQELYVGLPALYEPGNLDLAVEILGQLGSDQ
jgi:alkanesulfonate monooxygenase SsuD/methylene tetrahydromethanopterin reductase-like flavin-dependent oxidoreductase (luciferase family)